MPLEYMDKRLLRQFQSKAVAIMHQHPRRADKEGMILGYGEVVDQCLSHSVAPPRCYDISRTGRAQVITHKSTTRGRGSLIPRCPGAHQCGSSWTGLSP